MRKILCFFGIHNWEIHNSYNVKTTSKYGKVKREEYQSEFMRECLCCGKEQKLSMPEKYHPCKYVWLDLDKKPWNK